jgi:general secretion pathway protein B
MSYILDALRKAERERGIAQVPTLMTVHDSEAPKPRTRLWAFALVGLASAILVVCFAVYFLKNAANQLPSDVESAAGQKSEPASPSTPADAAPSPAPLTKTEALVSSKRAEVPANGGSPVASSENHLARKSAADESHPAAASVAKQQPDISSPQAKTSIPPPQSSAKGISSTAGAGPAGGNPQAKDLSLREAMSRMKITILMYDENKSERMVFINDRKYVEGDYVDGRYLVENITTEGVVLSYQGERALLRPGI